ncbi:MAG: hypothetical protein RR101_09415, partial [Burkholderiaceae bacterium]
MARTHIKHNTQTSQHHSDADKRQDRPRQPSNHQQVTRCQRSDRRLECQSALAFEGTESHDWLSELRDQQVTAPNSKRFAADQAAPARARNFRPADASPFILNGLGVRQKTTREASGSQRKTAFCGMPFSFLGHVFSETWP